MQSKMRTPPLSKRSIPARSPVAADETSRASASRPTPLTVDPSVVLPLVPVASTPVQRVSSPQQTTPYPSSDTSVVVVQSPESEARLMAENCSLKKEIEDLRQQMKAILDHSTESDQRLLQYTNNVFAVGTPSAERDATPALPPVQHQQTQTDAVPGPAPITSNTPCPRCVILKEESANMILTIRALEQQINSQQDAVKPVTSNNLFSGLTVRNRFSVLANSETASEDNVFTVIQGKRKSTKKRNRQVKGSAQRKTVSGVRLPSRKPLNDFPFKSISISGDSHARHLAGLIKDLLPSGISVGGICKPGAGLLSVATTPTAEPSSDRCHVLIAGTNDVANGGADTIFNSMETIVAQYSSTSKLLVATLPHRYDLAPYSPINRAIGAVNKHMAEICERHEGVELLEFSDIHRSEFTTHGMHLRMRGKRTLARMIVGRLGCLVSKQSTHRPSAPLPVIKPLPRAMVPAAGLSPASPLLAANTSTSLVVSAAEIPSSEMVPAAELPTFTPLPTAGSLPSMLVSVPELSQPFTLPHDSYADALTARNPRIKHFLGEPGPR